MSVIIKHLLFLLVILPSTVKGESDQIESGGGSRLTLPPVEKLGPITKWMSDPPPQAPMKPTLQDKYHRYRQYQGFHDEDDYYNKNYGYNLEALRLEDKSKTLAYQPNIDFLAQNCIALNYHWPAKITIPSITMSLSPDNNVDIQQIRESAPSGCIVVMIGARNLPRMNAIVHVVEHIMSQLAIKLVTYFGEKTEVMPVVDLDNSPKIVRDYRNREP